MWGALSNETASAQLQLTNASVLELAVFYCDIMHDRETACRMAKAAFDDAVVEVRDLSVRQLVVLQGVAASHVMWHELRRRTTTKQLPYSS